MILQFGQVEWIMQVRLSIAEESALAFRGRLQHFQKLKFPSGVNTGKGKPAQYGWEQLFELAFALDFVELGLLPDAAANLVRDERQYFLRAVAGQTPGLLQIQPSALSHMRGKGHRKSPFVGKLDQDFVVSKLTDPTAGIGEPVIVLNPSALTAFMVKHVATIASIPIEQAQNDFDVWCRKFWALPENRPSMTAKDLNANAAPSLQDEI